MRLKLQFEQLFLRSELRAIRRMRFAMHGRVGGVQNRMQQTQIAPLFPGLFVPHSARSEDRACLTPPRCRPSQKCLASRTVPETANTAPILIRFCVAIDIADDEYADGRLVFDFFRFAFGGVVFADMTSPEDGGSGLFEA